MQDGAVDLKHGTRVDGTCIPAPKATTPSKAFVFKGTVQRNLRGSQVVLIDR
jgi:hypothetical protein